MRRPTRLSRDHYEVAVPRLELLQAEQHFLALRAAHRPARALLLLARRQVELLVLTLRALLGLVGTLGRDSHHDVGGARGSKPGSR